MYKFTQTVSRFSRQFSILNTSQPYRPPRPDTGIVYTYAHVYLYMYIYIYIYMRTYSYHCILYDSKKQQDQVIDFCFYLRRGAFYEI
jgi:hypothetical protein